MSLSSARWRSLGILLAAGIIIAIIMATAPEPLRRGQFLVVPGGWWRLGLSFVVGIVAIALAVYSYGKATRPGKAGMYASAAATHMVLLAAVFFALYPALYLLAVSFSPNDNLYSAPPREGNVLVRAGIVPDMSNVSLRQYQRVLADTNILAFQWVLLGALLLVGIGLWLLRWQSRRQGRRFDAWQQALGWSLFIIAAVLVVSISPDQFYSLDAEGRRSAANSEQKILLFIRNTLLVSGMTGLFAVLISTTAGYAFARMRFPGRYQTLLLFIFVQMFPGFMALVAIFYLMNALDLLNSHIGLILAYSGGAISFASWIFKGYLESISPSLEEAAMVDGATRWGAFWRIILPVSVPMLIFIFMLQFIGTYSEFILANILLTGDNQWTIGLGLRTFTAGTGRLNTQWGALAASAVLGSIPILLLFYSFQESLTGQHQAGGVKG